MKVMLKCLLRFRLALFQVAPQEQGIDMLKAFLRSRNVAGARKESGDSYNGHYPYNYGLWCPLAATVPPETVPCPMQPRFIWMLVSSK